MNDPTYRYALRRDLVFLRSTRRIAIVGMNPSTADDNHEDPTSRQFAWRVREQLRGTEYTAVNLYAGSLQLEDPIGPSNDAYIEAALMYADVVWLAWGSPKSPRPPRFEDQINKVKQVISSRRIKPEVVCLGRNKDGQPKHPLYLPHSRHFEAA